MKKSILTFLVFICIMGTVSLYGQATVSGELKKWHKVTLTFNGPNVSETSNPNPFTGYRLNVTFTHQSGSPSYVVPGYWAADGDAANTSATSGNKWQVNFTPDETGTWNYSVSFRAGTNISINTSANPGSSAGFMDGELGSFSIAATNKTGKDFRATGRTKYVGEHYLQFQETGKWMVKGGADAPENTLAYNDFDATPNQGNRRKTWQPHQQDYKASEAAAYTWKNGNGSELLGVVRYLGEIKDCNAMSFLTYSLQGDDGNIYPHRQKQNNASKWNQVDHDRFDVSKMDQWGKIFDYATTKGVFLHFKTHETENDQLMTDIEGKIYYRELVARYGHLLSLVWNITEEVSIPDNQVKSWLTFLNAIDPYNHVRGLHTYPGQKNKYNNYLGNKSELTYASIQTDINAVPKDVETWVNNSRNAGKRWVVCNDEQGSAKIGVDCDPKDNNKVLEKVIWGTLMNGGMGFEFYYGYQTCESDLTAQNHRTRDTKYNWAGHALKFFNQYFNEYLPDVRTDDAITSAADDEVLRNVAKTAYVVFRPKGGSTAINLPAGNWFVRWYNPKNGNMGAQTPFSGNLVAPSNTHYVALLTKDGTPPKEYTLTSVSGANGSISQSVTVIEGSNHCFTVSPAAGYELDSVIRDGVYSASKNLCFNNVQTDHNIRITFKEGDPCQGGQISDITDLKATVGVCSITLEWTPQTCATSYIVRRKLPGGKYINLADLPQGSSSYEDTQVQNAQTYIYMVRPFDGVTIPKPKSNLQEVTADCSTPPVEYTLSSSAGNNGSISSSVTLVEGSNHCFTATPAAGYLLDSVIRDGIFDASQNLCFNNIQADHTIRVTFKMEDVCTTVPGNTTVSATDETSCGQSDGTITFSFVDDPVRTAIQFSIDGGNTYTKVNDNSVSYTFSNLVAGTYNCWVQWGNGDCPTDLGNIEVSCITSGITITFGTVTQDCNKKGKARIIVPFTVTGSTETPTINKGQLLIKDGNYRIRHTGAAFGSNQTFTVTVGSVSESITVKTISSCPKSALGVGNEIAVEAYPNPVDNELTISISNSDRINYSLIAITGTIVKNGILENGLETIDVSTLQGGVYTLMVYSGTQIVTQKISIVR